MGKYKEIFKLKKMLEDANIPFDFVEGFGYDEETLEEFPLLKEHYQICYPSEGDDRWISVIQGFATYGGMSDRLEIMGGLTPKEEEIYDEVIGWLTANNVFKRIQKHYNKNKEEIK